MRHIYFHISSVFAVTKRINLILEGIENLDNGTILESDCAMDQYDEVLHSTINFDIFIKGGDNEQVATKD